MTKDTLLKSDRLVCRNWQDADLEPFARMCADPEVMKYFPEPLTYDQTAALIDRAKAKQEQDGFCFVPVETRDTSEFLGFVGLSIPMYAKPLPFGPCVEVGWRLKRSAWGRVTRVKLQQLGFDSALKPSVSRRLYPLQPKPTHRLKRS